MVALDPKEVSRWNERVKPISEQWVKSVPGGEAVLQAYRAELAKLRSGS